MSARPKHLQVFCNVDIDGSLHEMNPSDSPCEVDHFSLLRDLEIQLS